MRKILLACAMFIVAASVNAQKKVALVFDAGGKNDRSFNQATWEGAKKAEKDFKITLRDVEPGDSTAVQEAMRNFAKEGYDLVVGIGFANAPAVEKAAKEFPKVKFAIIDSRVDFPNVASLEFKEQEGSFLVGVLAAMNARAVNNAKSVGFIGGMDIPLIHKFEVGFAQGVKAVDSKITVLVNYVGNTPAAWNDPAKGKEIAESQIAKGATVIYSAAGGSGAGLFDAIKAKNANKKCAAADKASCIFAIGVDSNQNYILPGQILTSMLKRVDVATYNTIKDVVNNKFVGGAHLFGLESNGVGYALDSNNRALITKEMEVAVAKYRDDIIKGKIVVKATR